MIYHMGGKLIVLQLVVHHLDVLVDVHEGDLDACGMSVTILYCLFRKNQVENIYYSEDKCLILMHVVHLQDVVVGVHERDENASGGPATIIDRQRRTTGTQKAQNYCSVTRNDKVMTI